MEAYKPIVDKAVAYGNAHEGSAEEKVEKTVDKMFVLFGAEILKVVPGMYDGICQKPDLFATRTKSETRHSKPEVFSGFTISLQIP